MKFYNLAYPNVDDIVICLVSKIEKEVIYTKLLEYDNIEGLIQLSNASTRRKKRSVLTVKEGKIYPLLVLAIDHRNGYIDLSNKFLSDEDKAISMEKYNSQSKAIKIYETFFKYEKENNPDTFTDLSYEYQDNQDIFIKLEMEYMPENRGISKQLIAEKTIWKLPKYKCYDYLKSQYLEKGDLSLFEISNKSKDNFRKSLNKHFGSYNINSVLIVRIINTNFGGVNGIIELFKLIESQYNEIFKLLVAPSYKIEINSEDKLKNENKLNEIYNFIEEYCKTNNFILTKEILKSEFT